MQKGQRIKNRVIYSVKDGERKLNSIKNLQKLENTEVCID